MTAPIREPSPFDGVTRRQFAVVGIVVAAVIAVIVGGALLVMWVTDEDRIVHREPIAWTVVGTADGGRAVVVMPLRVRGICDRYEARLLSAPAGGPVRIAVDIATRNCRGAVEAIGFTSQGVRVALGGPLAGRALEGPKAQPLVSVSRGEVSNWIARENYRLVVPGVIGMTQRQARIALRKVGYKPVPDPRAADTAVVTAQRPAPYSTVPGATSPGPPPATTNGVKQPSFPNALGTPVTADARVELTAR